MSGLVWGLVWVESQKHAARACVEEPAGVLGTGDEGPMGCGLVRCGIVCGPEDGGAGGAANSGKVVGEVVGASPEVGGELDT